MKNYIITLSFCCFSLNIFAQQPVSQIMAQDLIDANVNWGLSYFNLASSKVEFTDIGPSSWNVYQYIAANYRFDWSQRLSIRLPYNITTPGVHDRRNNIKEFSYQLADVHFVYSHFNAVEFPGEWDLSTSYYIYLPTGELSQQKKWLTRLRAWFNFENKINRRTLLAIWIRPDLYVNTQKAYRHESTNITSDGTIFHRVNARNNTRGNLETSIVTTYGLNSIFSPQLSLSYQQTWFESSAYVEKAHSYQDKIELQLATWIRVTQRLSFLLGYSSEQWLTNGFSSTPLFNPSQSQYVLMTFWNFF